VKQVIIVTHNHNSLRNIISLINYLIPATRQAITHIWESRWFESMYTLQGKPDQHATCISHSVHVWFQTIHNSCGQRIATFRIVVNRFEQIHCSREERLPTQPTACWLTGPRVHTQPLFHNSQWCSGETTSFYWQPATRFTELISPACDRYVQYFLVGTNPSILKQHRKGLQPWRCRLFTYHSPTFPTNDPSLFT
jgi:hypothetical protein